jgi:ATP-binding cassette subfamily B protein RaxB
MGTGLNAQRQREPAECGLACLAACAQTLGLEVGLDEFRRAHAVRPRGMTARNLIAVAALFNMSVRALRGDLTEACGLPRPTILHWRAEHFVVLRGVDQDLLRIFDPLFGDCDLPLRTARGRFSGVAFEVRLAHSVSSAG